MESQEEGDNANQVMHFQNFLYVFSSGQDCGRLDYPFYVHISVLQMDKINLFRAVKIIEKIADYLLVQNLSLEF